MSKSFSKDINNDFECDLKKHFSDTCSSCDCAIVLKLVDGEMVEICSCSDTEVD